MAPGHALVVGRTSEIAPRRRGGAAGRRVRTGRVRLGARVFANNAAYVASKHGLAALAAATFLDVREEGVRVSVVSPGLVAAGAGKWSPLGQAHPERLLTPEDVASAVEYVVGFPGHGCPVLVELQPLAQG